MEQMDKQQVLHSLSMTDCIRLMRTVLREHAQGKGQQYLRTVTCLPGNDLFGFMPAHLGTGDYFGAKVITVFPGNHQVGLPSHQGSVLLFDAQHGTLQFMADGDAITQIRTGAVSAVATDLLAQPGAGRLALLGAGAQGRSHLEAIALIRRLTDVAVWDARPENAQKFAAEMAKSTGCPIRICSSAEEAARDADIICTLTPSPTPILESGWVQPGAHINAVGACSATTRELNSALVARCRLYGDSIESVEKESGDYLIPLSEGAIQKEHLLGTIGQLLCGEITGRTSAQDVTVFDALALPSRILPVPNTSILQEKEKISMKKIGLIGGLSWQSTVEYYRVINEESNRRLGGGLDTVECILYSVNLAQKLGRMARGEQKQLGQEFLDIGKKLVAAGADVLLLCTNTMHAVYDVLSDGLSVPVIHIADATADAIKKQGLQKVALLGTPFTMTQPFYKGRLKQLHGIDVLLPTEEQGEEIYRVINEELTFHILKEESRRYFLDVIDSLRAQGAQGAILGCTEIPLLIQQEHTDLPVFDTTVLHAMAAVDAALA